MDVLRDLFFREGHPAYIRSDNGSEFRAEKLGVKTACTAPGSPWENGYNESFNGRLRNELLNCESFCTLKEAQVLMEGWRRHYNDVRPHSPLGVSPAAMVMATPLSRLIPLRFMMRGRRGETEPLQRAAAYLKVDHDSGITHRNGKPAAKQAFTHDEVAAAIKENRKW